MMLRAVLTIALFAVGISAGFGQLGFQTSTWQASWNEQSYVDPFEGPFSPIDDREYTEFCHSYCSLDGVYSFQRDWIEIDEDFLGQTNIFEWSYDGPKSWWDGPCPDVIDDAKYGDEDFVLEELEDCRPAWIYIVVVELEYQNNLGQLHWTSRVTGAYQPSENAWKDWAQNAKEAFGAGVDSGFYDYFDALLLYYPESSGSVTDDFNNYAYWRQTYIANYEPNFCSMHLPFQVTDSKSWCNGRLDEDDDTDTTEYPTFYSCDRITGYGVDECIEYEFGCDDTSDECDRLEVDECGDLSKTRRRQDGSPSMFTRLSQATSSFKKLAQHEKRSQFFTQGEVAGIKYPYCAVL